MPTAILLFIGAAGLVWWAGTRLMGYAAAIGERTGIGQAFTGMLLVGGITSLPELSTATSAAIIGAPELALNNVIGSAAFNIVLLAVADAVLGKAPLTSVVVKPATLLQGVLGMILLAVVVAAIVVGDTPLLGVGTWSALLFCLCLTALWVAFRYESRPMWAVINPPEQSNMAEIVEAGHSRARLISGIVALAALIAVAGTILASTGHAIAESTGLGDNIVGLLLVAVATSLPELSTIVAAMSVRRYELAIGEIFGSNLFNLAIIFVVDLAASQTPVLSMAGPFEALAALLALTLTGIFVIGLLERRNRTVLRMGYDSILTIVVYAIGVIFLTSGVI